ncbi:hypothetical protein E2C01_009167 [Portunus trituberculatus]|uniref:Uncharacterized protein n=1 Tax=Portunus trituberculatus TaxID=210409 RepID=A0A5B7D5A8_PORTR|nr:hypothetical protein [Portunus trituberculatus]
MYLSAEDHRRSNLTSADINYDRAITPHLPPCLLSPPGTKIWCEGVSTMVGHSSERPARQP